VLPVLWHLKVSHYNEKARWALDHKRIPHVRRAAIPGLHHRVAAKLTGGTTLPVLVLGGEAIGDSTRIIEALEKRRPEPRLYPADPGERERALALEDFFDEQLGPYSRRAAIHHMLGDPDVTLGAFFPDLKGIGRAAARVAFPLVRRRMRSLLAIDERSVELAYERVREAGERFRAELQPSGYLVGEGFSVADLTLASLLAPAVAPPQYPYPQPQRAHPLLAPLREALAEHGLVDWTLEIYARHRGASAATSSRTTQAALHAGRSGVYAHAEVRRLDPAPEIHGAQPRVLRGAGNSPVAAPGSPDPR
jgi:glutathione S-transferase